MLVYHTGRAIYSKDLTGKGAELFGGRWNRIGVPCIYTSGSKSLSLLEYAVNVKIEDLPGDLCITAYDIPDDSWKAVPLKDLPASWQQRPFPRETAAFGTHLLMKNEFLAIRIPSVIIPDEFNFLLNPLHSRFHKVKIAVCLPLAFDTRIKR